MSRPNVFVRQLFSTSTLWICILQASVLVFFIFRQSKGAVLNTIRIDQGWSGPSPLSVGVLAQDLQAMTLLCGCLGPAHGICSLSPWVWGEGWEGASWKEEKRIQTGRQLSVLKLKAWLMGEMWEVGTSVGFAGLSVFYIEINTVTMQLESEASAGHWGLPSPHQCSVLCRNWRDDECFLQEFWEELLCQDVYAAVSGGSEWHSQMDSVLEWLWPLARSSHVWRLSHLLDDGFEIFLF